jgi:hypothetical protein
MGAPIRSERHIAMRASISGTLIYCYGLPEARRLAPSIFREDVIKKECAQRPLQAASKQTGMPQLPALITILVRQPLASLAS